jgi:hypothetical protein
MWFYCLQYTLCTIKNSFSLACQSLVLADYGVKTRHCQLCGSGASLLCFFSGNVPSFTSLETNDTGFVTKCENIFACIQYFSMWLAAAEKVLWPIICRLSGNNRPITDYLKNGRLIYNLLIIYRLIGSSLISNVRWQQFLASCSFLFHFDFRRQFILFCTRYTTENG